MVDINPIGAHFLPRPEEMGLKLDIECVGGGWVCAEGNDPTKVVMIVMSHESNRNIKAVACLDKDGVSRLIEHLKEAERTLEWGVSDEDKPKQVNNG